MAHNETAGATRRIGMLLFAIGGVIVALLASLGPGIGPWVIGGFGAATLLAVVGSTLTTRVQWGVAIPVGLLTAALGTVYLLEPGSGGTNAYAVTGVVIVAIAVLDFVGVPLAKSAMNLGRQLRQRL